MEDTHRIFLLSPANVGGKRAQMLLNPEARFELAQRLRMDAEVSLGEAFAFMSGLYFRGKLAYARAFARPPEGQTGVLIITSKRGRATRVFRCSNRCSGRTVQPAVDSGRSGPGHHVLKELFDCLTRKRCLGEVCGSSATDLR